MTQRFWYPLSVPTVGFEEIHAATEVLQSGQTTMGDRVEAFEGEFARHVGARHAVMVNSGSSADLLMAFATKPSEQAEVLIPAVTWPTHVWAFWMAGYHVRFVDVDQINTTADILAAAITDRTRAVSVPHLMGVPVDLGVFKDLGFTVTEDCCEALGADVARVGVCASWSFFFSHHMTTMEGGMVTTDDPGVDDRLRSMRSHGWTRHRGGNVDPYLFATVGFNVRPMEVSAAVGLVQLSRLDGFNKLRDENRQIFAERLAGCAGVELPTVPAGLKPSWFGLPFFVEDRDGLAGYLADQGVETRPILGGNLTRQPAFRRWAGRYPAADRVHDHGLYVGLHPLHDCGIEQVADLIGGYVCG